MEVPYGGHSLLQIMEVPYGAREFRDRIMDSDDDDTDLESEIAEMLAFETAALASLRAGDPDLAVQNADGTLRCPLCSPAKKKQSYAYQDLLQHATAVAVGIRGPEAAGKHSALKLYLESDLLSLAAPAVKPARPVQEHKVLPRRPRREADDKLVCPWSVIIYYRSSSRAQQDLDHGVQVGLGKNEIKTHFADFKPDKIQVLYGPNGHLGVSILQFGRGFAGLNNALALENYFMDEDHGRRDYDRNSASGNVGQGFYGWLARGEDLNGRAGLQGAEIAKCLHTYGDLKDIETAGEEMNRIREQQIRHLSESLAEKYKESLKLKTEIDLMQRRAEADRQQFEESYKPGKCVAHS